MSFGESLSGLMLERNVNSKTLAGGLGVTHQSVNNWKANRTDLSLSYLIKLCNYFECSLEYLVGKTDVNTKPQKQTIGNFGQQVRKLMKSKGISSYTLRNETRFAGGFFYDWDKGSDPKLSTLIDLANYFKCSLDELVGLG